MTSSSKRSTAIRTGFTVLKFVAPVAIIAALIWNVERAPSATCPQCDGTTVFQDAPCEYCNRSGQVSTFDELSSRPKNWTLLGLAFLLCLMAVTITFIRWYFLVRALGLPFRFSDALRLGFLCYLLNFVSVGSVGGDLFKAVFLAREQKGRRTEAVATVMVDRLFGLFALFVVASAAILWGDLPDQPEVNTIARVTLILTGVGIAGIVLVLLPGFSSGSLAEFLAGLPKVGSLLDRLFGAVRIYRRQPGVLAVSGLLSLGVHSLFAVALWLTSAALFPKFATLGEHLVIVPLGILCGAIPFTPAGLGAFELAIDFLNQQVPTQSLPAGQGLVVALAYRVMTIGVAAVGMVVYWTSRSEVRELMEEAQQEMEDLPHTQSDAVSAASDETPLAGGITPTS